MQIPVLQKKPKERTEGQVFANKKENQPINPVAFWVCMRQEGEKWDAL